MKNTPFLRSVVLLTLLGLLAPHVAQAQNDTAASTDKKKEMEPVRLRFICAAGAHPIKFRLDDQGFSQPYYDEGDIPPEQIFYKDGKDYKRVCLNENAAPGQCVVQADKRGAIPTTFYTRKISSGTDAKGKATTPVPQYTPLVTVNGLGGKLKDALVCLYNPNLTGKWSPPKTLVLDASTVAVPEGGVLVVNLSKKIAALQIGSAKPVTLKPGEHTTVAPTAPGTRAVEQIAFKMAVADAKGAFAKVGEYSYSAPAGSRQVLTLYAVDEKITRSGIEWFVGDL